MLAGGAQVADIVADFHYLGEADVRSALAYVAQRYFRALRGKMDWRGDLDAMLHD